MHRHAHVPRVLRISTGAISLTIYPTPSTTGRLRLQIATNSIESKRARSPLTTYTCEYPADTKPNHPLQTNIQQHLPKAFLLTIPTCKSQAPVSSAPKHTLDRNVAICTSPNLLPPNYPAGAPTPASQHTTTGTMTCRKFTRHKLYIAQLHAQSPSPVLTQSRHSDTLLVYRATE